MALLAFFLPFVIMFLIFGGMWLALDRKRIRQREFWATLPPSREPVTECLVCPRCQGSMARGYLLDISHAAYHTAQWLEGAPTPARWGDGIRPQLERSIPVTTFRCEGCGFLESYARPEGIEPAAETGKPKQDTFREL